MPNDLLAIKKIFPDSSIAYKFNHYVKDLKRNVLPNTPIIEPGIKDFFKFGNETINPELKFIALGSEALINGVTENHKVAAQQKFLSKKNDYKNFEASWYVKFEETDSTSPTPWVIYGRSTGRRDHKKPCLGSSYRAYLRPDGMVRLCKESYFGNKAFASDWKPAIPALTVDQIVGMKFICFNMNEDTAVRLELWLDELNNNNWHLFDSFTDTGSNLGSGASKCQCTNDKQPIVWGGPVVGMGLDTINPTLESNTHFTFTKATVREINAGGIFAEARAGDASAIVIGGNAFASTHGDIPGSDTGGGLNDGAGGIADDTDTGTGEVNTQESAFTIQQSTGSVFPSGLPFSFPTATASTTSNPVGSPTTGTDITATTGTNQAPEKPLVTVYKDLGLLYNIVLDSESACDVGSPFQLDYRQIYSVGGQDEKEIKLFNNTGGVVRIGAKAHSSASVLVGQTLRKVVVPLRRFGFPSTGHIGMEIRDRLGNLMTTFTTQLDPAVVLTGPFSGSGTYEFKHDNNKHKFQAGDMLLLTYHNAVDANANNCIIIKDTEKDEIDGFDTIHVRQEFQGSIYRVDQSTDFVAGVFI